MRRGRRHKVIASDEGGAISDAGTPTPRAKRRKRDDTAPWSARCSRAIACAAKQRSRSAASRRCRRCARWREARRRPRARARDRRRWRGHDAGREAAPRPMVRRSAGAAPAQRARSRSRSPAAPRAPTSPRAAAHARCRPSGKPMRTQPPARAGQRPAGTTQGRAPQHGARDGRRARARSCRPRWSTTPTCTPGSASRTSPRA